LRMRSPLCCLVSIKTPAPSLPNRIPFSREQHIFIIKYKNGGIWYPQWYISVCFLHRAMLIIYLYGYYVNSTWHTVLSYNSV
jgi:hypothetical protein